MDTVATIILAAGKGTRMKKTDGNKVVALFHGIPLIEIAVKTALSYSLKVVLVVGVHETSVRTALAHYSVDYVHQAEQKGTAHAAELGVQFLAHNPPQYVVVGYGDHMMFYSPEIVKKFIANHISSNATMSLVTANYTEVGTNAYGRIIRTPSGSVARIVEKKDATEEEKTITEINAGLYCLNYSFLAEHIRSIKPSVASGEYYLTDMVEIVNQRSGKVAPFVVPFSQIGYGINSKEDLEKSLNLSP